MKLTLIREDKTVIKDGVGVQGLPFKDFPSDVWAVQWDGTSGTVEKNDLSIENISDISPYNAFVTEFDTWVTANSSAKTKTENDFRNERNNLLEGSDWTQLPDSPLSDSKKTEWATYRQALRDLPTSTSDYNNVSYPTEPS